MSVSGYDWYFAPELVLLRHRMQMAQLRIAGLKTPYSPESQAWVREALEAEMAYLELVRELWEENP